MASTNQPRIARFDFLERPHRAGSGAERAGRVFKVELPWTLLEYGAVRLKAGWWRLECTTSAPREGVEVRLRSATDPLIVFPAVAADLNRVYLRGETEYEMTVLVSPWPGSFAFGALRLVRLSAVEGGRLLASGAMRVLGRDKPLQRLATIGQRLMAGQSFGIKLGRASAEAPVTYPQLAAVATSQSAPTVLQERGSVTAIITQGDTLDPRAFEVAGSAFERSPHLKALYADVCEAGQVRLHTGWDRMLAREGAFDTAPLFVRKGEVPDAQSARSLLAQLVARHGDNVIAHMALPLAARTQPTICAYAAASAPQLSRTPTVSVIIPTKIRIDLFERCLTSLSVNTGYPALQVVVVDNGSTDPRMEVVLAHAAKSLNLSRIVDVGPFNYSRLINAGVAKSDGEIVLVLNDDIEATEPGWLHRMISSAMSPEIGAVGARLVYPDGTIQHAGVMMGLGGPCGHLWKGLSRAQAELNPHVSLPGRRMAVTGACLAVRREAFDLVSGFDEVFPVAFNDIDFCLRLHLRGLMNIYRGDAVLVHHESQSRGMDDASTDKRLRLAKATALFLERWKGLCADDPYGSPAFDRVVERGIVHLSLR